MAKRGERSQQQVSDGAVVVQGSQEAFRRFLPEARRLDVTELVLFRNDPVLAHHNVVLGVGAVLAEEPRLQRELRDFDFALIRTLPELALGVVFADAEVYSGSGTSATEVSGWLAEAAERRRTTLLVAEGLAGKQLLPATEVARIQSGSGPIDIATDLVQLAALFERHQGALAGKSPIDAEELAAARALGDRLLRVLKPKAAGRKRAPLPPKLATAIDDRNRLWTLLVQRYLVVQRAAGWLWGPELAEHVPPIRSRHVPRRKKQEQPAEKDSRTDA